MATFSYTPDRNIRKTSKPTVLVAEFGDGYTQRLATTINNIENIWNLTFRNRTVTEINNIISFLEATGGAQSFDWTPPGASSSLKVICDTWSDSYITNDIGSATATFKRVYET